MQTNEQLEAQMQALGFEIKTREKNIKTLRTEIIAIQNEVIEFKSQRAEVYRTICAQRVPKVKNSTGVPGRPRKNESELSEVTKYQYGLMQKRLIKQKENFYSNLLQSVVKEREAKFKKFFEQATQACEWYGMLLHNFRVEEPKSTEEQKLAAILQGGYHIHLAPMQQRVNYELQFVQPQDTEFVQNKYKYLKWQFDEKMPKWLANCVPNHKHLVQFPELPAITSSILDLPEFPTITELEANELQAAPAILRPWGTEPASSQPWLTASTEPTNTIPAPTYVESTRQRLRHKDPEVSEQTIAERSFYYNVVEEFNPDVEPVDDSGARIKPHPDAY